MTGYPKVNQGFKGISLNMQRVSKSCTHERWYRGVGAGAGAEFTEDEEPE